MVDTPKAADVQEAMKKQIADLRREMNKINKTLSERAEDAADEISGWVDGATERVSSAAKQVRTGAQSVSETVQQNPGTVSTALMLGGVVGFMIGMLVAQSGSNDRRWY